MSGLERPILYIVPSKSPSPEKIGEFGSRLNDLIDVDHVAFSITYDGSIAYISFTHDLPTARYSSQFGLLEELAKEMADLFPHDYNYGVRRSELRLQAKTKRYLRWTKRESAKIINRESLSLSPVRDLMGILIHANVKFSYQVLLRPFDSSKVGVVPRLAVHSPISPAVRNSLSRLSLKSFEYPETYGDKRSDIRRRFHTLNPVLPSAMEGEHQYIRINPADLGLFLDFPADAPELAKPMNTYMKSGIEKLDDLRPSEQREFLYIQPEDIAHPPALEKVSEQLYQSGTEFGKIEALYVNDSGGPSILIRPQFGSLDKFCDKLSEACPKSTVHETITLNADSWSTWSVTRYYKPENSTFRPARMPTGFINEIMHRFNHLDESAVVQLIFDPFEGDQSGFLTTFRVLRPPGANQPIPGDDNPVTSTGLKPMQEESINPFVQGSDDLVGTLPEPGYHRWFLDSTQLGGLLLFRPFWKREAYLPDQESNVNIRQVGPISTSVPDIEYGAKLDIQADSLPENLLYNPKTEEFICRNCESRYAVPTVTEGPKSMADAFTCCSNTIDDADMDAIRQPSLVGVDPLLADEWEIPQRILEFIALVGKVQFKELDPVWEYNYRDSMTSIRNHLDLGKSDIDPLIVPEEKSEAEGLYPLRRRRFSKKYYSLTSFGRKLLNRTRTYGETVGDGIRDLNESSAHVIGVHITAQFAESLPSVSSVETYVSVNDIVDLNSLESGSETDTDPNARIDVVGFNDQGEPVACLEYELDADHPSDTLSDAEKMGLIAKHFDGLVGYITPTQSRAKDLAEIMYQDANRADNELGPNPVEALGEIEELQTALNLSSATPIPELTQSLLLSNGPLGFIETLGRIEDILDNQSIVAAIEDGSIKSINGIFDKVYAGEYARYSEGDFLMDV